MAEEQHKELKNKYERLLLALWSFNKEISKLSIASLSGEHVSGLDLLDSAGNEALGVAIAALGTEPGTEEVAKLCDGYVVQATQTLSGMNAPDGQQLDRQQQLDAAYITLTRAIKEQLSATLEAQVEK